MDALAINNSLSEDIVMSRYHDHHPLTSSNVSVQSTGELVFVPLCEFLMFDLSIVTTLICRFYSSLLNCLHLVLVDPKGSLHDHVS